MVFETVVSEVLLSEDGGSVPLDVKSTWLAVTVLRRADGGKAIYYILCTLIACEFKITDEALTAYVKV